MKRTHLLLGIALLGAVSSSNAQSLPRATPESQGVSSDVIRAYIESADQKVNTMHSLSLIHI